MAGTQTPLVHWVIMSVGSHSRTHASMVVPSTVRQTPLSAQVSVIGMQTVPMGSAQLPEGASQTEGDMQVVFNEAVG